MVDEDYAERSHGEPEQTFLKHSYAEAFDTRVLADLKGRASDGSTFHLYDSDASDDTPARLLLLERGLTGADRFRGFPAP